MKDKIIPLLAFLAISMGSAYTGGMLLARRVPLDVYVAEGEIIGFFLPTVCLFVLYYLGKKK